MTVQCNKKMKPVEEDMSLDAPRLSRISKEDPFVVPERFFSQFPQQLTDVRIAEAQRPSLFPRIMRPAVPAAAILALALWWNHRATEKPADALPALSPQEFMAYTALTDDRDLDLLDEAHEPDWENVDVQLTSDEFLAYAEARQINIEELILH